MAISTVPQTGTSGNTSLFLAVPDAVGKNRGGRVAVFQGTTYTGGGTYQLQGSLLPPGTTGQVWADLFGSAVSSGSASTQNVTIFPFYRILTSGTVTGLTPTIMV